MKLYRTTEKIILETQKGFHILPDGDWDELVNRDDLYTHLVLKSTTIPTNTIDLSTQNILAPIKNQEIWAAGVTYLRSRNARMEESKQAGGDSFYDKVYVADRPEIFFKATAQRCVGTKDFVRIRKDSTWDVPEPELTLFITSSGKIVAYTIGNDMSSRSIEGENPLYLPQAKTYQGCAALGPCLYIPEKPIDPHTKISLEIRRATKQVFWGQIPISQMKRQHQELADYLFRECSFPNGCFLMTGTGIVPEYPFTLQSQDEINISIDNIGTLRNVVE